MRSTRRSLRLLLSCAALLLATPAAQAQVCEGNVWLTTQAQVDAFACTEVTGNLSIGLPTASTDISDLSGLSELTSVGGHLPISNIALTSLAGLENLTSIGGSLSLSRHPSLTDLDALGGLTSVGVGLWITDNDALTNLDGLEGLTSLGGDVTLSRNPSLTDLDGLGGLTSVGGSLRTSFNDALTSLAGLGGLTSIGGGLMLESNNALTSLAGLEGLTSVYFLEILSHDALTSLAGLEGLTSVDFHLRIQHNDVLTNVDAFASITSVGGFLRVSENPALSECTVGLAPLLLEGEIGGGTNISNNAPGCNSVEEILAGVSAEDGAAPLVTGLAAPYPNPTAGAATVTYTLAEPGEVSLTVYDALGRRVAVLAEGSHAAGAYEASVGAGLPAGAYVVRLEAGGQAFDERVTVVR